MPPVASVLSTGRLRRLARSAIGLPSRLHRNNDGTISIISVFAVLLLVMLLGMVMNVGRQVDGKIRMQNAADAVSYSGGVVLARGMNTLAFTNHLLCEIFAMDAFMREAHYQNSQKLVPGILEAWTSVGQTLSKAKFPKFAAVGSAILQEATMEQQLVTAYSQWASATSDQVLPMLDTILSEKLIPQYQQAVVAAYPDLAQNAAMAVSLQNGMPDYGRGTMQGALWRTSGEQVGGANETSDPTLPVADPEQDSSYLNMAQQQRCALAQMYLTEWNNTTLSFFINYAKMSQFSTFWSVFTCGYLNQLLNQEYPSTNLPLVIRNGANTMGVLHSNLTYVGVAYWDKLVDISPVFNRTALFQNPAPNSAVNFATVRVFVPTRRLRWWSGSVGGTPGTSPTSIGGVPGNIQTIGSYTPGTPGTTVWQVGRDGSGENPPGIPDASDDWSLWNQNWTAQLVPTVEANLLTILTTQPSVPGFTGNVQLPNLGGVGSADLSQISPH